MVSNNTDVLFILFFVNDEQRWITNRSNCVMNKKCILNVLKKLWKNRFLVPILYFTNIYKFVSKLWFVVQVVFQLLLTCNLYICFEQFQKLLIRNRLLDDWKTNLWAKVIIEKKLFNDKLIHREQNRSVQVSENSLHSYR